MVDKHKSEIDPDLRIHQATEPFDVQEQDGRRAMWLLLAGFGFLLLLALLIFKIYQPGVRDRGVPPTVNADRTPFKIKPEDPGGAITPDQNKEIYKVIDGETVDGSVNTVDTVEKPINIPDRANIIVKAPEPLTRPAEQAATPPRKPVSTAADSVYVAQVASVRSRAAAEDVWTTIEQKYDALLPDRAYADIKRADLDDKGVFYRLRLAGIADKAAANRLCERLVARGQACFVTKK